MMQEVSVFWFRRDLRLHDNAALYHALRSGRPVVPVFIFDRHILDQLEDKSDKRVAFIHRAVENIHTALKGFAATIDVRYGFPEEVFQKLAEDYNIREVYTNHDYEPYARDRDDTVGRMLREKNIALKTYKDQVIFEKDEVLKDDGSPYTVFTPYSKRWKTIVNDFYLSSYPNSKYSQHFFKQEAIPIPTLEDMGFTSPMGEYPPENVEKDLIKHYKNNRDFPAAGGTSRLGVHLRFGTISIRDLARFAAELSEVYVNELIWREFYQMILWHFPHVGKGRAFRPEYENIRWRNNEDEFELWCKGETGYPLVDAGMRELNQTGFMHNRVRMVVASFLCKHLLIDWRWGEGYFASKLLDFDLASNNGGWQWAAGSGCDAAPYFRIFNPYLQAKKFDPEGAYIRKWVPEFEGFGYTQPIVDHDFARKRCIEVYSQALKRQL